MARESDPDDVDVEALLRAYPSVDGVDRDLLAGIAVDAMGLDGLVGDHLIEKYFDLFVRDGRARLLKEMADRAGITFSEAKLRWKDPEDVAAEIGHRAMKAVESWGRCQRCGVHPEEMFREDNPSRPIEFPKWKFEFHKCRSCEILRKLNEGEDDGDPWRIAPRSPGDDLQDGPGLFD